jgi:hypothetical protein
MSSAELKGCHAVQNLGAVQTYLRRYLWTTAFELVEHDALDATTGSPEAKPKPKAEPKVEVKEEVKIKGKEGEWQMVANEPPEGDPTDWLNVVGKTAEIALGFATSKEDVMNIFKKNKTLFDSVKRVDPEFFATLMESFTATKQKFGD